jgi:hypothetical protein
MAEPLAVTLAAVPGSPGLFQGSHVFRDQGQYVLKARGEDARFANSLDIVVSTADLEGLEPAMQEPLLRKMAAVRRSAAGCRGRVAPAQKVEPGVAIGCPSWAP